MRCVVPLCRAYLTVGDQRADAARKAEDARPAFALDLFGAKRNEGIPQLTDRQSPAGVRYKGAATPKISRRHSPSETAKPRSLHISMSGSVRVSTYSASSGRSALTLAT